MFRLIIIIALCFMASCSNILNQVTSQNYAGTCAQAEKNGHLDIAEEACSRALANVYMGNLGDALKSTRQYDLARIKRLLGKFSEAEMLLRQSIELAQEDSSLSQEAMGRRYIELAVNLAAQGRWNEGFVFIDQAMPTMDRYKSGERAFVKVVLMHYADSLEKAEQSQAAAKCRITASNL